MNYLTFFGCLLLVLCGCSLYEKNESSNELEALTQDVLKAKEGIDIQVRAIHEDKK